MHYKTYIQLKTGVTALEADAGAQFTQANSCAAAGDEEPKSLLEHLFDKFFGPLLDKRLFASNLDAQITSNKRQNTRHNDPLLQNEDQNFKYDDMSQDSNTIEFKGEVLYFHEDF